MNCMVKMFEIFVWDFKFVFTLIQWKWCTDQRLKAGWTYCWTERTMHMSRSRAVRQRCDTEHWGVLCRRYCGLKRQSAVSAGTDLDHVTHSPGRRVFVRLTDFILEVSLPTVTHFLCTSSRESYLILYTQHPTTQTTNTNYLQSIYVYKSRVQIIQGLNKHQVWIYYLPDATHQLYHEEVGGATWSYNGYM